MTTFFMSTWWGDSKNMEEIEFSRWLFEGRPRQGKNVLPDWLNWLCYLAGSSKPSWEFNFLHIFGIPSSSRHGKRCKMLQTLFLLFQCSKNQLWFVLKFLQNKNKNHSRIAWRKVLGKKEHKNVAPKKPFGGKKKDLLLSKIASATTIYYIIK